jgi:hypothetical protein
LPLAAVAKKDAEANVITAPASPRKRMSQRP